MKLRRFAAVLLSLALLAGCSQTPASSSSVAVQSSTASVSQAASSVAPVSSAASAASSSTAPASSSSEASASSQVSADTTPFDAASALTVEAVDGGMKYIFSELPQTSSDLEALIAIHDLSDARTTAAYFFTAFVRYVDSPDDAFAMIDVLRGPQPMSDGDKAFIKERLSDKLYLPRAYFEGAEPKNEYEPTEPWTIILYDDPVAPPEGYAYAQITTSGAENPRRITMRVKDGQNYLWEYNGALLSIKLPASEDPWA